MQGGVYKTFSAVVQRSVVYVLTVSRSFSMTPGDGGQVWGVGMWRRQWRGLIIHVDSKVTIMKGLV